MGGRILGCQEYFVVCLINQVLGSSGVPAQFPIMGFLGRNLNNIRLHFVRNEALA